MCFVQICFWGFFFMLVTYLLLSVTKSLCLSYGMIYLNKLDFNSWNWSQIINFNSTIEATGLNIQILSILFLCTTGVFVLHLEFPQRSDWTYVEILTESIQVFLFQITSMHAHLLLTYKGNVGQVVVIFSWLFFKHRPRPLLMKLSVILQHLAPLFSQAFLLLMRSVSALPFLFLYFSCAVHFLSTLLGHAHSITSLKVVLMCICLRPLAWQTDHSIRSKAGGRAGGPGPGDTCCSGTTEGVLSTLSTRLGM